MLVGAGGNAGNVRQTSCHMSICFDSSTMYYSSQQASVRVIRGLALGSLNEKTQNQFLLREVKMAGALSCILSLAGFLRTVLFHTPLPEAIAVTSALSLVRWERPRRRTGLLISFPRCYSTPPDCV